MSKEKDTNKTGFAAAFSLGLIAGYKGVGMSIHVLYAVLVVLTFIYSGGIVEWVLN